MLFCLSNRQPFGVQTFFTPYLSWASFNKKFLFAETAFYMHFMLNTWSLYNSMILSKTLVKFLDAGDYKNFTSFGYAESQENRVKGK